jgi:tyrosine-protein phosphatase SIW14
MSTFYQVDGQIWRGPRPQPADILLVLSKFKSVLDLEDEDADIAEQNELAQLRVFAGNISDWEIYSPLFGFTLKKLNNILDMLTLAPKPCLVHCLHGQDRTGIVVAAYQVRRGWTKDAAMAEARKYGYRWYINFGLNRVWKQFK